MTFAFAFAVIGAVLLLVIAFLRKYQTGQIRLPRQVSWTAGGLLVGLLLFTGWVELSEPQLPSLPLVVPAATATTNTPLEIGEQMPPLKAQGWLNNDGSEQPGSEAKLGKITVVDIWGLWCPYSESFAPGLVELHERYAAKGVSFVSISTDEQSTVKDFAQRFSISWLSGYQASPQTIARFNALNTGAMTPGYEVRPTIYLIGTGGRVLWWDNQARYRHCDAEETLKELAIAIDKVLN